jgi:predicted HTH domain antitoxin
MTTLTLTLPDAAFAALRRSPEEFGHAMRLAAAAHWYGRGEVSMEEAASIAGLDRADFLAALAAQGVDVFRVDLDALEREISTSDDTD